MVDEVRECDLREDILFLGNLRDRSALEMLV